MKTLTVFTPTFNRAALLPRLYTSLKNQTCNDFIWLIINDGCIDNTDEVVQQFIEDNKIEIQYIKQINQGMHGVHNTAYKNCKTVINTCIDDDDFMPNNAVELILNKWKSIDQEKYSGIIALDATIDGKILGTKFIEEFSTLEDFYINGGKGDKKLIYRTNVINQYPEYPIFEGEKYVGLGYKYLLADKDYQLATLNEIVCIVEYQPEGSSNNMWRQYYKNPKGFAFLRKEQMKYSKSFKRVIIDAIHYVAHSIRSKNYNFLNESPLKFLTFIVMPLGFALFLFTLYKNRQYSELYNR
jgi:glycosyltransferase involved in cell wall biosynthesis